MEGSPAAHWQFRPGTWDRATFESVVAHNEYRLPDRFEPDDVIVDVGGHIGSFSYAALSRGAGQVFTFEASPANCEVLRHNLAPFGARSVVRHAAVFRSDSDLQSLPFFLPADPGHTGGGGVHPLPGSRAVPAVGFDHVIDEVTRHGQRRVRLLKLDCEGSEWPILLTTRRLGLVDAICGEYHIADFRGPLRVEGHDRYSTDLLEQVLHSHGFTVELDPTQLPVGLFFAWRAGVPAFAPACQPGVLTTAARRSRGLLAGLLRLWPFGRRGAA
jgi:FkbM family methyltransferase